MTPSAVKRVSYKVALVGEPGAGKTSFLHCLLKGSFDSRHLPTSVDFKSVPVELPHGNHVMLQLWDIGGGNSSSSAPLLATYLSNCQAVLAMYDSTSMQSFAGVLKWLDAVRAAAGGSPPYLALVACKSDLEGGRAVDVEQHAHLAHGLGMYSFYTSSLTGDGVKATAFQVAADLLGMPLAPEELEAMAGPSREVLGDGHASGGCGNLVGGMNRVNDGSPGPEVLLWCGSQGVRTGVAGAAGAMPPWSAEGKRPMLRGSSGRNSGRARLPSLDLSPVTAASNSVVGSAAMVTHAQRASPLAPLARVQAEALAVPRVGLDASLRGGEAKGERQASASGHADSMEAAGALLADKTLAAQDFDDAERESQTPRPSLVERREISGVRRRKTASIWACCWG